MSLLQVGKVRKELREDDSVSLDQLQRVMPKRAKGLVTQEMVDHVNGLLSDGQLRQGFRDNLIGYCHVLQDGTYRMESYINAVMYVSYKLMGDSNIVAWSKTFPERYQRLLDNGTAEKDIASVVTAYNKTQLVVKIMEQSLIPSYVLNQELYQKALNTQAELMLYAKSEKVRCDAANSLLTQLKMPETQKVTLDVSVKEDDSIGELRKTTLELVKQQREMIQAGAMRAAEVAASKVITVTEFSRD